MMTLVGGGPSRWVKPYWLLKELKLEFEEKNGFKDQAFLAQCNPHKKVPVLIDGDFKLTESTAIVNYLAAKHAPGDLIPKDGTVERARYDQWTNFVTGDLEQPLWRLTKHQFILPEADRSAADMELAKREFKTMAAVLETQITDHLVGDRFTVADIVMTYTLQWSTWWNLLDDSPKLQKYLARHSARPAFPKHLFSR